MAKTMHCSKQIIRISLCIFIFVLFGIGVSSCKSEPPQIPQSLTVRVNLIPNKDSTIIHLGDSVRFTWTGRRGENDMKELHIDPYEEFQNVLTVNGVPINSSGSYPTTFNSKEVYADEAVIPVKTNTTFTFSLIDVTGDTTSQILYVGTK